MDDATGGDRQPAAWPEGSALAALIRSRDWSATPLGAIGTWPAGLRAATAAMLNARRPTSVIWGSSYTLLYNDALRPLIGARHPAALGLPLGAAFPGVWESLGPALADAVRTGGSGGKRPTLRPCRPQTDPRTGRESRLVLRLTPIRDETGAVEGLLIPMRAVAGPEHEAGGEQRLASMLARAAVGLAAIGLDGRFLDVNDAFCRILGRSREALLASALQDVTHPDDAATSLRLRERVAETGARLPLDARYLRPDGTPVRADGTLIRLDGGLGDELLRGDARGGHPGRALLAIVLDPTERRRAEGDAQDSALLERIPQLVWRADGSGRWIWASRQWTVATGLADEASRGLGWLEAIHPDDRQATMSAWQGVGASGRLDVEHRIWHAEERGYRWYRTRAGELRDAPGLAAEWLGTCTDIHGMVRSREQQDLLIAELQHRMRNLLGIVRGIAVQVETTSRSMQDFSVRFDERLAALGRVQDLLSRQVSITLGDLVELELSAHGVSGNGTGRCRTSGPTVMLPGRTVQMLALALHELTTNAAKHGALATPRGSVEIAWRLVEPPRPGEPERLALTWSEYGVAMERGKAASHRGFGRELIEVAFPYELDATTHLEFAAGGARCRIELPMGQRR